MEQLAEVPGALERPGGCRIEILHTGDQYSIAIPARGLPPLLWAGVIVLGLNLLVVLYTGVMLLLAHKSVLFMTQISPKDLPVSMHPLRAWLILALIGVEALGAWLLLLIIRPSITREEIIIGPEEIRRSNRAFGRTSVTIVPRQNVRGFLLRRDPHGLVSGVLTLVAGSERWEIAEFVAEADREWLASVCSALLRR